MTAECGTSVGAIQTKYLCQDWPGNADFDTPPLIISPKRQSIQRSEVPPWLSEGASSGKIFQISNSFSNQQDESGQFRTARPVVGWRVLLHPSLSNIDKILPW
jgi:hypothetical protein